MSWLPPLQPNGRISKYTVYFREAGSSRHSTYTIHEPLVTSADTLTKELRDFSERYETKLFICVYIRKTPLEYFIKKKKNRQLYEFWVTASTASGEGEATPVVSQVTTPKGKKSTFLFSFLHYDKCDNCFFTLQRRIHYFISSTSQSSIIFSKTQKTGQINRHTVLYGCWQSDAQVSLDPQKQSRYFRQIPRNNFGWAFKNSWLVQNTKKKI